MKEFLLDIERIACDEVQDRVSSAIKRIHDALISMGCARPIKGSLFSGEEREVLNAMLSDNPYDNMPSFLWTRARSSVLESIPRKPSVMNNCHFEPPVIPPGSEMVTTMINGVPISGYVVDVLGQKLAVPVRLEESKFIGNYPTIENCESALLKKYTEDKIGQPV